MSTGIEYAHIYTDQKFGEQHERSVEELHKIEEALGETAVRVVLIDDYSPDQPFEDFSAIDFTDKLHDLDATPDVVVHESALVPFAMQTVAMMAEGKQKRGLEKYIAKNNKIPCSLFIAAWYLYRLDALEGEIEVVMGDPELLKTDKLVTVLPESFVTPETKADEIIAQTPRKDLLDNVERHYFDYKEPEYSPWEYFGTEEYVERNYLNGMLDEDKQIIEHTLSDVFNIVHQKKAKRVADIGAGPNVYPSMILTPFMADDAKVDLIEYLPQNLAYLEKILQAGQLPFTSDWREFEEYAYQFNMDVSLNALAERADIKQGSIFELPTEEYDIITSSFVADSITNDKDTFEQAVASMIDSLKPGGVFVLANMLGSEQYFAGEREYFPSVNLDPDYVQELYGKYGAVTSHVVTHEGATGARDGYSGMMISVGKKF